MEKLSPLRYLISALEEGNRYHISVEFFNKALRKRLQIPFRHIIHATDFCDAVKLRPNGLNRCMHCKRLAMDKARSTGKPFGGLCINGAYEYCYPLFREQTLECIIFVGNIINDQDAFLRKSKLQPGDPLIDTMQRNMTEEQCLRICRVVASYIQMLMEKLQDSPADKPVNATIAAIRSYVDCYFIHDISLTGLAKLYHYNEKYLGSLFKKETGMSFRDYLNKQRLQNATKLLRTSRENILDIAARSGFNNVTYFNRLFKPRYGLTPSQFRLTKQK